VNTVAFDATPVFAWASGSTNPTFSAAWASGFCPAGDKEYKLTALQGTSGTYDSGWLTVNSKTNQALGSGFTYDQATSVKVLLSCKIDASHRYSSALTTISAYIPPKQPIAPTSLTFNNAAGLTTVIPNRAVWTNSTCPANTTVQYRLERTTPTSVIGLWTTSLQEDLTGLTSGTSYTYGVSSKCVGIYTTSATTSLTSASFTAAFNIPSVPAAPTGVTSSDTGTSWVSPRVGATWNDALAWNAATCQSGSSAEYNVTKVVDNGVSGSYGSTGWFSGNSLNIAAASLKQGSTHGFTVAARCTNAAGSSAASAASTAVNFTTGVDTPAGVTVISYTATANDTFSWNSVTCPANTSPQYYANQYMRNGTVGPYAVMGWSTGQLATSSSYQGYPQQFQVLARCTGPNASGAAAATTANQFNTSLGVPGPPPTMNRSGTTVSWGAVACPAGATVSYHAWIIRQNNSGSTADGGWRSTQSWTRPSLTAGGYIYWRVEARCATPYVTGAVGATKGLNEPATAS
jgi:hypothetical protein